MDSVATCFLVVDRLEFDEVAVVNEMGFFWGGGGGGG